MIEQIGKVAGEKLDGVRACRLVRFTVAAAIVNQDRHAACEPLDHRLPERRSMAREWMSTTPFVPWPCRV